MKQRRGGVDNANDARAANAAALIGAGSSADGGQVRKKARVEGRGGAAAIDAQDTADRAADTHLALPSPTFRHRNAAIAMMTTIVRDGYNAPGIAAKYTKDRAAIEQAPKHVAWLDALRPMMPASGRVVDLGCGGGVPVTQYFAERAGYAPVDGYDVSAEMIAIARGAVPSGASFHEARMEDLAFDAGSVDVVVSLFAVSHLPRGQHAALFRRMFSWLRPGSGVALLSLGGTDNAYQQETIAHGVPMAWSHFDADTNLRLLKEAGFGEAVWSETTSSEMFVLVRRPPD